MRPPSAPDGREHSNRFEYSHSCSLLFKSWRGQRCWSLSRTMLPQRLPDLPWSPQRGTYRMQSVVRNDPGNDFSGGKLWTPAFSRGLVFWCPFGKTLEESKTRRSSARPDAPLSFLLSAPDGTLREGYFRTERPLCPQAVCLGWISQTCRVPFLGIGDRRPGASHRDCAGWFLWDGAKGQAPCPGTGVVSTPYLGPRGASAGACSKGDDVSHARTAGLCYGEVTASPSG